MTPDEFVTEDAVNVGWAAIYTTASPQEVRSALDAAGPLIAAEALRWAADQAPSKLYYVDGLDVIEAGVWLRNLADLLAPDPDDAL